MSCREAQTETALGWFGLEVVWMHVCVINCEHVCVSECVRQRVFLSMCVSVYV